MSRRRDRWSVTSLPGVLRANAVMCETAAGIQSEAALILRDGQKERRHRLAAEFQREAEICRDETLPLFWVTAPMAQVALDASQDVPVASPAQAPGPRGFLAVAAHALPVVEPPAGSWTTTDGGRITQGIRPAAFLWDSQPDSWRLTIYAPLIEMPGTQRLSRGPLQELMSLRLPRLATGEWPVIELDGQQPTITMDGQRMAVENTNGLLSVLPWLAATWHLMMMPTVAERKTLDAATGTTPTPATTSTAPREVTHVDLRPLRYVATTDEPSPEAPKRKHIHRWVVRGHWTHQPHGPGRTQRRLQWRESYIKGPPGAPLSRARPVNIWRR